MVELIELVAMMEMKEWNVGTMALIFNPVSFVSEYVT